MTDDIKENAANQIDLTADIARLDAELKSLREATRTAISDDDLGDLITQLEDMIPEGERAKLPTSGSREHQFFSRINAVLKTQKAPRVPETDTKRPALTTPSTDYTDLPAHARIAAGYGKA